MFIGIENDKKTVTYPGGNLSCIQAFGGSQPLLRGMYAGGADIMLHLKTKGIMQIPFYDSKKQQKN